jgi:SnoaL-like domain
VIADIRVQRFIDEAEISRLLLSFGAATGRDQIASRPAPDLERYDRQQHFGTNHLIDVDGDTATPSHYLIGIHIPDASEGSRHADVGGRYLCECRRTDEGWKLSVARLEILWRAGDEFGVEPDGDEP